MEIGGHDSRIYNQEGLANCPNCGRRFPPDKVDLHEAYCVRNFRKCELCGIMIDKNSIEEHKKELHSMRPCEFCGEPFMGRQLELHHENCLAKPELCKFCGNSCPRGQLPTHENTCGARTKACGLCNKLIPMKDFDGHTERCSNRLRERRQTSQEQRNNPQRRQLFRQNSENQLNLQPRKKSPVQKPQTKQQTVPAHNVIPREQFRQQVSIVPISIMIAIKEKQGHQDGGSHKKVRAKGEN